MLRPCPTCGAPLEQGAAFCGNCGYDMRSAHSETLAGDSQLPPDRNPATGSLPNEGPLIGRELLGQYIVRRRLGEGGMGEVYWADQPSVGRAAAIKVLHAQYTRDPSQRERFNQEARAAAKLTSPHIVAIYNYGETSDGMAFLAMELLEGRTLAQVLHQEGALHPVRAVKVASQVCAALQEAHTHGIVHRDLKPSNIMLVRRGDDSEFVKVLDFGVAKLEGSNLTGTGALFGTPQYMSPEQLRAETLDGRSDLYSLGIILYEMLSGRLPFSAPTPVGYVHKHLSEAPPPLRQAGRSLEIPPSLEAAALQLLAKDAAARPQTAAQAARNLQAAIGGAMPVLGTPVGFSASISQQAAIAPTVASTPAKRGGNAALVLGIIGGFVVLGVIGSVAGVAYTMSRRVAQLERGEAEKQRGLAENEDAKARAAALAASTVSTPTTPATPTTPTTKEPPAVATKPFAGSDVSPEIAELAALSVPQLEARLDLVLAQSILPPSSVRQVKEGYEVQKALGTDESQAKSYLVQVIRSYESNPNLRRKPGDFMTQKELEAVWLTTELTSPMTEEQRRQLVDQTVENMKRSIAEEDREFYVNLTIANMIRSMAKDAEIIDRAPGGIAKSP